MVQKVGSLGKGEGSNVGKKKAEGGGTAAMLESRDKGADIRDLS